MMVPTPFSSRIEVHMQYKKPFVSITKFRQWLKAALDGLKIPQVSVSLTIVGPYSMKAINQHWRNKPSSTDVLSFPVHPQLHPDMLLQHFSESHIWQGLGDIVICAPVAIQQAEEARISRELRCLQLLIHGLLHCCGHDHEQGGRQAQNMFREERRLCRWVTRIVGL
jgi:rRNA maturation RNase YbeY